MERVCVAKGKNGEFYSLFGPGEAIAAVSFIKNCRKNKPNEMVSKSAIAIAKSHYYDSGIIDYINNTPLTHPKPHALRTIMGLFNIFIGGLCVLVFYKITKRLTRFENSALFSTLLFAFGTLIFPYSGTFFSELLATLFVMLSFLLLLKRYLFTRSQPLYSIFIAGIYLGIAILTHLSAILFVPFFLILGSFHPKQKA